MGVFRNFLARILPSRIMYGPRRPWYYRGTTLVDEDNSMQVAAFNRGLIYISSQVAKLPWDVKDDKNNIVYGSISNLLNLSPNSEMSAFSFRLVMVQQAIIHGNSYAEIERNLVGTPINLWPLRSQNMQLLRDEFGNLVYRYYNDHGGISELEPRDVFHVANLHTKDGIVGQGVVSYAREVLGIQIAADNMAAGIFHNGGIPSAILKHPGKLSDEAYKRLKESWAEQTGGKKSGSTSILEEGMTYEAVNINPDALQFLQSRQFGVLEIARFLGLPPTKLFDVVAAKYANVENSNLEVATDTLDSWCTRFETEADIKILNYSYGNRYTDMDLYSIFRGDMKSRSDYFKTMVSIGTMTPNEIRKLEGRPGYGKDGDNFYIATNNFTPVKRMNEVIDADIEQKTKPATAAPAQPAPAPDKGGGTKDKLAEAVITYLGK